MMRALAIYLGLLVLGIILAVAGWVLTPGAASFAFPGPINVAGQALIALGLTVIVVAIRPRLEGLVQSVNRVGNLPQRECLCADQHRGHAQIVARLRLSEPPDELLRDRA